MSSRCQYCGTAALSASAPDVEAIAKGSGLIVYKCGCCGICSRVALDDEAADNAAAFRPGNSPNGMAAPKEEEILRSAQTLMGRGLWDEALDTLFKKRFPYKHPLEFLFYRNVCQTAVLFSSQLASPKERSLMLNLTALNLSGIAYYLADAYPETKSRTLQNAAEVFLLLGDLTDQYSRSHKDRYYRHCVLILSSLANIAVSQTAGFYPYDEIYLKTAARLLHKCLEITQEKPAMFIPYAERQLKIPSSERRQINSKINSINFMIRQIDPRFVPAPPLPEPKVISAGASYILLSVLAAAAIIGLLLFYYVFMRYSGLFGNLFALVIFISAAIGFLLIFGYFLNHIIGNKN